ncbi:GH1 family beta-glucosidase [Allorhizocola rhizosphaerae]|uniref:GH1 family beta-glucosidase n=1 Tax=Allorhizocola rhizosphaerae TaxID=1872709 RepID=UPI000E3C6AA3|nr:GH1 family beta-glucosidase [Allorhizocola rhizosphaerae]
MPLLAALAACTRDTPVPEPPRRFPEGFVWGSATSAYQVEGAAREDGRGPSIWDTFSGTPGKTRNGETGLIAADHYHRYAEDVELMASLGLRSYRFSIAWPRIQPTGAGPANPKGLDFYKRLVEALRAKDIAPVATLFHWDLPQALQDAGGWEARDTAARFADYATIMYEALGDMVPTFLTLNEPKTVVQVGYLWGAHAPGFRSPQKAWVAAHHLMLAHGMAVQALRATGKPAKVGPALNLAPVYPASDTDAARAAAHLRGGIENRFWLDAVLRGSYPSDVLSSIGVEVPVRPGDMQTIASPVDLLGIQYYNPLFVTDSGPDSIVTKLPTSQADWQQIHPDGLYDILTWVKREYGDIPLVITENGIPVVEASDDKERIEFLRGHFIAAHRALEAGVRLTGYHVWSLLDNFEWAEGYSQRWGLVYVDYPTQRRIPKASAHWYAEVIRTNEVR